MDKKFEVSQLFSLWVSEQVCQSVSQSVPFAGYR